MSDEENLGTSRRTGGDSSSHHQPSLVRRTSANSSGSLAAARSAALTRIGDHRSDILTQRGQMSNIDRTKRRSGRVDVLEDPRRNGVYGASEQPDSGQGLRSSRRESARDTLSRLGPTLTGEVRVAGWSAAAGLTPSRRRSPMLTVLDGGMTTEGQMGGSAQASCNAFRGTARQRLRETPTCTLPSTVRRPRTPLIAAPMSTTPVTESWVRQAAVAATEERVSTPPSFSRTPPITCSRTTPSQEVITDISARLTNPSRAVSSQTGRLCSAAASNGRRPWDPSMNEALAGGPEHAPCATSGEVEGRGWDCPLPGSVRVSASDEVQEELVKH
ncbi:unnamed protein product, partial [Discosporangium mesarthrocarpum]